ncbi:hypothetical protein [Armatimonas sp.]|uniref:hypothetical protein n=1 Tax=Armatimonas sp. TaxID=1872638 RepID=UPI00286D23D8|nr:hypothetical protein [Armatimonas sp.]
MKRTLVAFLPISLLFALTGCGGSGTATDSAIPSGGLATRGTAASVDSTAEPTGAIAAPFTPIGLFITGTDAATPTWGHVWATVYKVEGVGVGEKDKPVTLFSSGEGQVLDLTQPGVLPGAGVAAASLVAGMTRIRITLAPSVQASKFEQNDVETISLVPALPKDSEGRAVATLTLSKPFEGGTLPLVVDLAKFVPRENKAGLELAPGDAPKKSPSLSVAGTLRAGLLVLPGGGRLALQLAGAQLANADGTSKPKPTDGSAALAEGTLSVDGKTLTVSRLTLGRPEAAALEGTTADLDPKLGTFTLTLSHATGILPTRLAVTATLAEKAIFRSRGGLLLTSDEFLTALKDKSTLVRVEGTYEPATGALSVRRGWLLGKSAREAMVTGTLVAEEKSGALSVTAPTDWDGFAPTEKPVALTTTTATAYLDEKGATLTPEAFKAALKEKSARALGLLDGDGRLAVTKLTLVAPLPKPTPEPAKKPVEDAEKKPVEGEKKTEPTPDKKLPPAILDKKAS